MNHWPDISTLTIDCLFCAVSACEGSQHQEDAEFSEACSNEIRSRLAAAREKLAASRVERAPAPVKGVDRHQIPPPLPKIVHKPFEVVA